MKDVLNRISDNVCQCLSHNEFDSQTNSDSEAIQFPQTQNLYSTERAINCSIKILHNYNMKIGVNYPLNFLQRTYSA